MYVSLFFSLYVPPTLYSCLSVCACVSTRGLNRAPTKEIKKENLLIYLFPTLHFNFFHFHVETVERTNQNTKSEKRFHWFLQTILNKSSALSGSAGFKTEPGSNLVSSINYYCHCKQMKSKYLGCWTDNFCFDDWNGGITPQNVHSRGGIAWTLSLKIWFGFRFFLCFFLFSFKHFRNSRSLWQQ